MWLAEHNTLQVKRIIKGIRKDSRFHDRLTNEAHLLKNLKNPCIPKIIDLEEDDVYTYIIEEYIEGTSLKNLCLNRLLSEKEIIHFMIQLCKLISYLHSLPKGLLYLDIKPENIIICDGKCFLIDFGSAMEENAEADQVFGTRSYAAPEQMRGERLSKQADVYSMGMLLNFMLSNGVTSLKSGQALHAIAGRCTSSVPFRRFRSAEEIIARLNETNRKTGSFSKRPLRIAFSGAAGNTGTTYIALLFSAFVKHMGRDCAYLEMNDSEAWYAISAIKGRDRALAGLEVLSRKFGENRDLPECDIISDYGVLKEKMPDEFYEADCCFLTVGNRCWEHDEIKRLRALSRRCKNRTILVNLTGYVDDITAELLAEDSFLAIPYIESASDIFLKTEVKSVLYEMMVRAGCYDFQES